MKLDDEDILIIVLVCIFISLAAYFAGYSQGHNKATEVCIEGVKVMEGRVVEKVKGMLK